MEPAFDAFPVATDSGSAEPVVAPSWADFQWSVDSSTTAFEICEEGWTLEEAQAAVDELDISLGYARLVEGDELRMCMGASSEGCFERLIHFFPLPDETTGGVTVVRSSGDLTVYYFRIAADCSLQRLGNYSEKFRKPSCDEFGMYMWGIPPISEERRQCRPANGLYSFDAVVTQDTCGDTPARFTGLLAFSQYDRDSGSLWFPELAGHPAQSYSHDFYIKAGTAHAMTGGPGACGQPGGTAVTLDLGSKLTITNERTVCDETAIRSCTWSLWSTRITGPL
jgi:hypothetical protein